VRVAEYGPSRRADVADLMERVWGKRPGESELEWFYERNPVRQASVLLAEDGDRVVGSVAISYQPLAAGVAGFAVHLATDPAHRGRGVFSELQAANEARAREAGVALLLTVPTPASARILIGRLGWTQLPSLRVWARPWPRRLRAPRVVRFDDAYLDWRFAEAPREYALYGDGTVVGRRSRVSYVARGNATAAVLSLGHGVLPTPKTFTLLGKSLDGSPLPQRVQLQFGDLDFL
jgi:GNAT superfamily N-acetyltransferase